MMRLPKPHRRGFRTWLLFAGYVCWIISGPDLRKALHADGVDLRDAVLERGAFNLILDLTIPQGAFKGDELPLLERLGEPREIGYCCPTPAKGKRPGSRYKRSLG